MADPEPLADVRRAVVGRRERDASEKTIAMLEEAVRRLVAAYKGRNGVSAHYYTDCWELSDGVNCPVCKTWQWLHANGLLPEATEVIYE